jgi:hypothetical protein
MQVLLSASAGKAITPCDVEYAFMRLKLQFKRGEKLLRVNCLLNKYEQLLGRKIEITDSAKFIVGNGLYAVMNEMARRIHSRRFLVGRIDFRDVESVVDSMLEDSVLRVRVYFHKRNASRRAATLRKHRAKNGRFVTQNPRMNLPAIPKHTNGDAMAGVAIN